MPIYVDHTHLWRRVTGIERVTLQLFSREALAPLDVVPVTAKSTATMTAMQTFGLPALLARTPSSLLLCPGFPPTPLLAPFGGRVIPYIHDVFLLSRPQDLNWRARLYSAWPFGLAVRRLPRFMVNSADTATRLAGYCRDDAEIIVYRPPAQNSFRLDAEGRAARSVPAGTLRLVSLGTVEPRKNFIAAARIVAALRARRFPDATLEIVGRRGWGDGWSKLSVMPGVTLHGYQSEAGAGEILRAADALICTSHAEGLGLPLLEAQYAGLPVIAPDQPVFREVLGASGIFVDPAKPHLAATAIEQHIAIGDWRAAFVQRAAQNLQRWNAAAGGDRERVVERLAEVVRERESLRQFVVAR